MSHPATPSEWAGGYYPETVTITKSLTLIGVGGDDPDGDADDNGIPDPTKETVVQPAAPGYGFGLFANSINVSGFVFFNSGVNAVGVYTSPTTSGYNISQNVFARNSIGLVLNSSGARLTKVQDNTFFRNDTFADTITAGLTTTGATEEGIYSKSGLVNALINNNDFKMHPSAAIDLEAVSGPVSLVTVGGNTSNEDGNFVALFGCHYTTITNNDVTDSDQTQIYVGQGSGDVAITQNDLTDGARGIRLSSAGSPMKNIYVGQNNISMEDAAEIQVDVNSLIQSTITGNRSNHNAVGNQYLLWQLQ